VGLTTVRHFRLWTRQCNCHVVWKRAGATPRTFWAAESRKSGVAAPVLVVFRTLLFGIRFNIAPSFSGVGADRVKTLVQDEVQSKNVTFFTARGLAVSRVKSLGTVLDGRMGDDRLICDANDPLDGTIRCRIRFTSSPDRVSSIATVCWRACKSYPIIRISASFGPSTVGVNTEHSTRAVARPASLWINPALADWSVITALNNACPATDSIAPCLR
jgi:hypothetical protein